MPDEVLTILLEADPAVVQVALEPDVAVLEVVEAGPQGPTGPDGWSVPIQRLEATASTLVIDYALGKHLVLALKANVTTVSIINWPPAEYLGRLTIEIENTGNFAFYLPATVLWSNGLEPANSVGAGKSDTWILTTHDGGATVKGHVVGTNYS